jgi:putative FmdB family regulatory protein
VPTYQYACTACDHRFEAVQSFTDASLTECPACSGVLRKVFSSVGIVFKGSGFYRTDSRSGGGSGTAATNGTKTETKTNSSSESKSTTSSSASSTATSTPASAAS